jgi:hypothetical protein
MTAIYSADEFDILSGPHVARAWFLEMDLPSGLSRVHSGVGTISIGGYDWRGVTDPIGGQLVELSAVEEPRFGQAVAVTITLSGANLAFFQSVKTDARAIEGVRADIYWAAFDGETGQYVIGLKKLFPGKITAPRLKWSGVGVRAVSITVESIWSSQNFGFGGRWNSADQQRRYAGDKGLDWVGQKIGEQWR